MSGRMNRMKYVAVLVSLLACCPVFAKKGALVVDSDPAGAIVLVDGVKKGQTPCSIENLDDGTYMIELRKTGFESFYTSASLIKGEQKNLRKATLVPITGLLLANSTPQGADVLIDGVLKGQTPLLLTDLALGEYRIEFRIKDRFLPCIKEVALENRLPVLLEANLDSRMARLTANSVPQGAEVRINGVLKGTTPVEINEITPGPAELRIAKQGYIPHIEQVTFEETTAYERAPLLEALPAGLTVYTDPPEATVFVDDKEIGLSPVTLDELDGGVHEVSVMLEGYAEQTKVINLQPSVSDSVDFTLLKDSGTLMLVSEPAGTDVYVDGKFYTTTLPRGGSNALSMPVAVLLKSGRSHNIQLFKDGYVSEKFRLKTKVDEVINRHESLKRIFIYDTLIVTKDSIIKCRLEYQLPNGDYYYERFQGAFGTAKADDVLRVEKITLDDECNSEARLLLQENDRIRPIKIEE